MLGIDGFTSFASADNEAFLLEIYQICIVELQLQLQPSTEAANNDNGKRCRSYLADV